MLLDQPEVRCKNGHVIPANATVQAPDKYGHQHVRTEVVNGVPLQTSRLVCEECAREAGGTLPPPSEGREGAGSGEARPMYGVRNLRRDPDDSHWVGWQIA